MSAKHGAGAAVKCLKTQPKSAQLIGKAPKQRQMPDKPSKPIHRVVPAWEMTDTIY